MKVEHGKSSPEGLTQVVPYKITEGQGTILTLAAEGMTNRRIARRIGISPQTVETQLNGAYSRLQVPSRTQAVLRAARYGMITLPELSDIDVKRIQMLTPREEEVAQRLVLYDGAFSSIEALAKHFNLTKKTIECHREHIQQKLETESITQVTVMMVLYEAHEAEKSKNNNTVMV